MEGTEDVVQGLEGIILTGPVPAAESTPLKPSVKVRSQSPNKLKLSKFNKLL